MTASTFDKSNQNELVHSVGTSCTLLKRFCFEVDNHKVYRLVLRGLDIEQAAHPIDQRFDLERLLQELVGA
jgi:hypothetical protein